LPSDDTDLTTTYSTQDLSDVASDDSVRVAQSASVGNYAIHQFKDYATGSQADITWNGQSTIAPSVSKVYLQIYNHITTTWNTLASNSIANADEDFNLIANAVSLDDYQEDGIVSCRVYQLDPS